MTHSVHLGSGRDWCCPTAVSLTPSSSLWASSSKNKEIEKLHEPISKLFYSNRTLDIAVSKVEGLTRWRWCSRGWPKVDATTWSSEENWRLATHQMIFVRIRCHFHVFSQTTIMRWFLWWPLPAGCLDNNLRAGRRISRWVWYLFCRPGHVQFDTWNQQKVHASQPPRCTSKGLSWTDDTLDGAHTVNRQPPAAVESKRRQTVESIWSATITFNMSFCVEDRPLSPPPPPFHVLL